MAEQSLSWVRTPTGRLMSGGSRFLIDGPFPIKANTLQVNEDGCYCPEERVLLIDAKDRKNKVKYLCLRVIDAQALAHDLAMGRDPWCERF